MDWDERVVDAGRSGLASLPELWAERRVLCLAIAGTAIYAGIIASASVNLSAVFWNLISSVMLSVAAVLWHRRMILHEAFTKRPELPIAALTWAYIKTAILIGIASVPLLLVALIPITVIFPPAVEGETGPQFLMATMILSLAANLMMGSLGLALPAAATERELSFKDAFEKSAGSRLSIAIALTVVTVPSVAFSFFDLMLRKSGGGMSGFLAIFTGIASSLSLLLAAGLAIVILNNAYLSLVGKGNEPQLV